MMYIFKNSMKNLLRNKGRNIMIFLILLTTMTAVTTCAIVRQASDHQIKNYIKLFKPSVSMLVDYDKLAEDYPTQEVKNIDGSTYWESSEIPEYMPSMEQLEKWASSSYVDHTSWWLETSYNSDYTTFVNDNLLGDIDITEYYGKDMTFFRQMAVTEFEAKKTYYLSELFRSSSLYSKLYDSGHIVTEDEAAELAARTVFGDKNYEAYLSGGISDDLAKTALDIKLGYSGMLEVFISQNKAPTGVIWAHSDFEKQSYFADKLLSLSEGHYPYGLNECLVSQKFAEMNNLKIGDTVRVSSSDQWATANCADWGIGDTVRVSSSYQWDGDITLELTISGLFCADYFDATASDDSADFMNYIFTSPETLQETDFSYNCPINPTFYLDSTEDISAFKQMLTDDGLSKYVSLTDNANEQDEMIENVKKISNFSTALMIITLVLGGSVFLLLTFLAIGERKYEIGVLRSIGMRKSKVIRGFLYETAAIVLLCCMIGMLVGTMISQPVADMMLTQSSESASDVSTDGEDVIVNGQYGDAGSYIEGDNGGVENNETETEKEELSTRLSLSTVLVILGTAFLLMIAAVVIAGLYITKFEPIKILSEQE